MFTTISPGGAAPASGTGAAAPIPEAPKADEGTVSQEEALKGGQHAQMSGFTVSDLSARPGGSGAGGSSVALGGLVQGKVIVELIDSLLPAIIVVLFKRLKLDAKKAQFQLSEREKNVLAPIWEACLNSINLDFSNPWTTLAVSMAFLYGGKALEVGGVQYVEKKAGDTAAQLGAKTQAPVVPINANPLTNSGAGAAQPPRQNTPPAATDNGKFTNINPNQDSGNVIAWSENEIKIVMAKAKKNRKKAIKWLELNWIKNGCQLPAKWL